MWSATTPAMAVNEFELQVQGLFRTRCDERVVQAIVATAAEQAALSMAKTVSRARCRKVAQQCPAIGVADR